MNRYLKQAIVLSLLLFSTYTHYGQPAAGNKTYNIEKKELYFSNDDRSYQTYLNYPKLSGSNPNLDKINSYLYKEFMPLDSSMKVVSLREDEDGPEENMNNGVGSEYISFEIEWSTDKYLCLSKNYSVEFRGAAHNSFGSDYYNFDMQTGSVLIFDDIFEPGIYDVIRADIINDFNTLPKEQLDTFNARDLRFNFYFTRGECYEDELCLMLYFAPYSHIGDLTSAGYIGWNTYIAQKTYAPHLKKKWKKAFKSL